MAAQARRLAERQSGAATGWALRPRGGSIGDGDRGEGRRGRKVAGPAAAAEAAIVACGRLAAGASAASSRRSPGWEDKQGLRG
jgi:hypothetical protein